MSTLLDAAHRAGYLNGKLAQSRPNGRRVHVDYIGVYTDTRGRRFDAWVQSGLFGGTWVRLEPFDGKRARFVYDPGHSIQAAIRRDNSV